MRNAGSSTSQSSSSKENYSTLRAIDPQRETAVSGPRFQQCFFENRQIKQSKTLFARSSLNRQGQRRWPFRRFFFLLFLLFLLLRHAAAVLARCRLSIIPTRQIKAINTNDRRKLIPGSSVRCSQSQTCSPSECQSPRA